MSRRRVISPFSGKWRKTARRARGRAEFFGTVQISVWIRRMVIEITGMSVYSLEDVRSTDMLHRGINLDRGNSTKNKLLYLQRPTNISTGRVLFHVWAKSSSSLTTLPANIYYSEKMYRETGVVESIWGCWYFFSEVYCFRITATVRRKFKTVIYKRRFLFFLINVINFVIHYVKYLWDILSYIVFCKPFTRHYMQKGSKSYIFVFF